MKAMTGSRLEKLEINNVYRRIQRIDDDMVFSEAANGKESVGQKILRKMRMKNLKMIDSNYYELAMQVKNVEDEDDALYLMRQINNSISICDEYRNSENCDEFERTKWANAYDKFNQLRDKLSSTVVYKHKSYGLFVSYPDIVENRY